MPHPSHSAWQCSLRLSFRPHIFLALHSHWSEAIPSNAYVSGKTAHLSVEHWAGPLITHQSSAWHGVEACVFHAYPWVLFYLYIGKYISFTGYDSVSHRWEADAEFSGMYYYYLA